MYLRILKKDLKRKKTMNVIILLFVILAAMFVSSSVNNIISVMNGLDYYFDKAGLNYDYFIISMTSGGVSSLDELLDHEPSVKSYRVETQIYAVSSNFISYGEKQFDFSNAGMILSVDNAQLNYFDENDNVISEVKEGEIYIVGSLMKKMGLKAGDRIEINHSGVNLSLTVAGSVKDAFLGPEFMGMPRFIISQKDYDRLAENETIHRNYLINVYLIASDNVSALKEAISDEDGIVADDSISLVRMCYVLNMIVAGILLVVSVGLILISFAILRFTIGFTVAEEFREIGVMKAIGISNFAIRGLYIMRYFGISVVGAVIGLIASIPFGNMLLRSVSDNMVLGSENSLLVGLLCSVAVVAVIMLFCYSCTGKVKKLSPVDAVRSGQTGERFGRKSILSLGKSRLGATGFLAVNDVVSSPRQFGIIITVFAICLVMVMILANTANTLCSDKLIPLFGTTYSDVYYTDVDGGVQIVGNREDDETVYEVLRKTEEILAENGMPAECVLELQYKCPVSFNGKTQKLIFQQGKGTYADQYVYKEGTAPQNENEIALTPQVAEMLGVHIGDTVKINMNGEEKNYIVTAYFSSFNSLGKIGRLHENVKTDPSQKSGVLSIQVNFTDHPDRAEIDRRIELMKDIFDTDQIYNAADYVKETTASADTVRAVEYLVLMIMLIVTVMVIVLMERSFITKEKSEIALMKAIGLGRSKIVFQHTLRFVIVAALSAVIAAVLCLPFTKLCMDPIFNLMGTAYGVEYEIKPVEIFVVYPAVLLGITAVSAFFTSLYTNTITASQTADIE